MKLYIQLENNQPINHPILEDNLKQVFGDFDDSSVPHGFVSFERVSKPALEVYKRFDTPELTYEWVDGIIKDVWHIRDMTTEERQTKIDEVMSINAPNGWSFVEETCSWEPPTPMPDDGKSYFWNEDTLAWEEIVE